jgi:predicted hydrocarbon binding protein
MYKKIKTTEGREASVVSAFKNKFGEAAAEEVLNEVYQKFPPSKNGDKPLEEILEGVMIHQGIQDLIVDVETREAATVTAFNKKFGNDANETAVNAAHEHGLSCGQTAAKEKGNSCNAQEAFELLGNYFCDGMPCDRGAQVVEEGDKRTVWDHDDCIHMGSWQTSDASAETMCNIVTAWIDGFGKGLNPSLAHKREKCIANGDTACISSYELT